MTKVKALIAKPKQEEPLFYTIAIPKVAEEQME